MKLHYWHYQLRQYINFYLDYISIFVSIYCYRKISNPKLPFVNLLTTLPIGVVSKNDIGPLTTQFNMALCIDFEAFKADKRIIRESRRVPIICPNPKTP